MSCVLGRDTSSLYSVNCQLLRTDIPAFREDHRYKSSNISTTTRLPPLLDVDASLSSRQFFPLKFNNPSGSSNNDNTGHGFPYSCQYCNKGSTSKYDHDKHVRTHTGEKPFGCSECSFRTADRSSLAKHKRSHHPDVFNAHRV